MQLEHLHFVMTIALIVGCGLVGVATKGNFVLLLGILLITYGVTYTAIAQQLIALSK